MSKYCIMPFASLRIEDLKNKDSMGIRPCCNFQSDQNTKFHLIQEYLDSDFLAGLQQHFLTQDNFPAGCKSCQDVESKNHISIRQQKQKFFGDLHLTKTKILELDLFPSNTCNLACVMCSPKFSSAVGAESKKLGLIENVYNFDITTEISESINSLNEIEYATIAGGEFFYLKHRRHLLEKLLEKNQDLKLKITTNGTIYDEKNIDLLKSFKNLVLRVSIDGIGNNYNVIRYPATWWEVKSNIQLFRENLPNSRIETVMATQPLGIFSIFEWLDFANQNQFETHYNPFYGDDFSWKILTDEEKSSVIEWILAKIPQYQLDQKQKLYLLNFAKNVLKKEVYSPKDRANTLNKLSALYKIRTLPLSSLISVLEPWPNLLDELLHKVQ